MFTRRFSSEDEYEEWLSRAGSRVQVLKVKHASAGGLFRHPAGHRPVVLKYSTNDPAFAPEHGRWARMLEAALIGAILFYLFFYTASRITMHGTPLHIETR
ncbi:MAG TPA: hypothetical protein VMU16_04590 [Candidatus Binataceae bacterium]|nr:hypothetical protein [Candidatus Binataceae bacterium]